MNMKKLLCTATAAAILSASAVMPVMANDDITVALDGNILEFDVAPQIINDRTMVPLRGIFEALGATVEWDQATQTVTSQRDGKVVKLTINSPVMYVDNEEVTLDSPACIVDDRTLVPVRAISEAYGTEVKWYGEERVVTILDDADDPANILGNALIGYDTIYRDEATSRNITYSTFNRLIEFYGKHYSFNDGSIGVKMMMGTGLRYDPEIIVSIYDYKGYRTFEAGYNVNTNTYETYKNELADNEVNYAKNIMNDELAAFDEIIGKLCPGLSLKDFGVTYEGSSQTSSANENKFEVLRDSIIAKGTKSSDSYSIIKNYGDNLMAVAMYTPKTETIGFTMMYDGAKVMVSVLITPEDDPTFALTAGKEMMIGSFTNGSLNISLNTVKSASSQTVDNLINDCLEVFDEVIDTLAPNVSLSDFDIAY